MKAKKTPPSEKIEPCPVCKHPCKITIQLDVDGVKLRAAYCKDCKYTGPAMYIRADAIAAHNQLCRRVKLGEMAEEFARTNYTDPKGMDEQYLDGYHTAWYTAQRIFQYAIESEDDDEH